MKKRQVVQTTPTPTTEQLISTTVDSIQKDIAELEQQKEVSLSVFRRTADSLKQINDGLNTQFKNLEHILEFANGYKKDIQLKMKDNDAVRQRIIDIIGE